MLDRRKAVHIEVQGMTSGTVTIIADRFHVPAGFARRQQLPVRALDLGDASAGVLLRGEVVLDGLLPVPAFVLGIGPVGLARFGAGFRLVAVGTFELDRLVHQATVAEPTSLFAGENLANREGLAALGQDD